MKKPIINIVMVMGAAFLLMAPMKSVTANQAGAVAVEVNQADVASVDSIIAALYASISGPKGQPRDWDRFRSLFFKDARLVPSGSNNPDGATSLTVEAFIKRGDQAFVNSGFFERELGRATHEYGNMVQAFSAYDSKRKFEDPEPFARGINSIQLMWHNNRWWIINIFWQAETAEHPVPSEY